MSEPKVLALLSDTHLGDQWNEAIEISFLQKQQPRLVIGGDDACRSVRRPDPARAKIASRLCADS